MKIAIIGAGRNKNGIGPYIAKYIHKTRAKVTAVLGTTAASSQAAAGNLCRFGIAARAYTDFDCMVKAEKPDAIVIASPMGTHCKYLCKSVDSGMHVFCEKPFIWHKNPAMDPADLLDKIFDKAGVRKVKIAMNCQWVFSIPFYERLCGPVDKKSVKAFWMRLSPSAPGLEAIPDSVPHALSLLFAALGKGDISNFSTENSHEKSILRFSYDFSAGSCMSCIELVPSTAQPREFAYGFDSRIVFRKLDMNNYNIFFAHDKKTIRIDDPLELSVSDFIRSADHDTQPLVGRDHIYQNVSLLQKIYNFS